MSVLGPDRLWTPGEVGAEESRGAVPARRPRVLVIAEACNPAWVSIPLEGWSLQAALREVAEVHLVTQVRNRDDLIRAGYVEGREFTAIDSEAVAGPVYRAAVLLRGGRSLGWTTLMALSALSYPYFERLVWRRFGDEICAGRWDVVHRLTPVSPTLPSPLAPRCDGAGVPFVLGPLNGGIPWPRGYEMQRLREREFLSYVRGAYKLLPGYRRTLQSAAAIMCGSRYTLSQLPGGVRGKASYVAENGIDPERFAVRRSRCASDGGPLRVAFVGRLVPYKGPDVLLEAASPLVHAGRVVVTVVGDGPMMLRLKTLVRQLNMEGGVRLMGNVPHSELAGLLAGQDVFAFPSVREFGGAVVVEAMASGVVPVVVNYGGPGELVTAETGVRVPLGSRGELVSRFRAELEALSGDRGRVDEMGPRARERAMSCFTWAAKAREVAEVYRAVIGASR